MAAPSPTAELESRQSERDSSSPMKLLRNRKAAFASALLLADAVLVSLVIAYVPCNTPSVSLCVSLIGSVPDCRRCSACFQTPRSIGTLTCLRCVARSRVRCHQGVPFCTNRAPGSLFFPRKGSCFCAAVAFDFAVPVDFACCRWVGFLGEKGITVTWKATRVPWSIQPGSSMSTLLFSLSPAARCIQLRYVFAHSMLVWTRAWSGTIMSNGVHSGVLL